MITAIALTPTSGHVWPVGDADLLEPALGVATLKAIEYSRNYLRASNILDFLRYDHGVGSIEKRLRNLPWCGDMQVEQHTGSKRTFTIGILTITEED